MTVLTPANAFPGIAFPQHLSGQSSVTSYLFPGAVQPTGHNSTLLSYTGAFPGITFPQHLGGQGHPFNQLYQGGAQPHVQFFLTVEIEPVTVDLTLQEHFP